MKNNSIVSCLGCGRTLEDTVISAEHIIPDAIGGRIKHKGILCVWCNSRLGASVDKFLTDKYAWIAQRLILDRERPMPDTVAARDKLTGRTYVLEKGGDPVMQGFAEANEGGWVIRAGDERQARRLFNRMNKNKKLTLGQQEEVKGAKFHFVFGASDDNAGWKRAMTKIAASFVRFCGLTLDSTHEAVRYAFEGSGTCRSIFPQDDVISEDPHEAEKLRHVLVMHRYATGHTFVYISLFEVDEIIIDFGVLGDGVFARTDAYIMDHVSGRHGWEKKTWALSQDKLCDWSEIKTIAAHRVEKQKASLIEFLRFPQKIWIGRATKVYVERHFQEIESGASVEVASERATEAANAVAKKYGLTLDFAMTSQPY